jgi:hypothetical protein
VTGKRSFGALAALAAVLALFAPATATAESLTFTGEFPPIAGACGPYHDFSIGSDITAIDAVATAAVPANDIVLNLHHPQGSIVASSDSATSPEALHYPVPAGGAGTYSIQICVAGNAVAVVPPYTYAVQVNTTTAPLPPIGGGGTVPTTISGTPTPTRTTGSLKFAPATVVDAQRTEGEPLNVIASGADYWESGPFGTSTQQSWVHRSTDNGLEFHTVSPVGLRPDAPPGGGDTDIVVDDQGYAYFSDLEALTNVGVAISNDHGGTWRKSAISNPEVVEDRQWMAVDNGTSGSAADNTVFLSLRQVPAGSSIYSTPGSTGVADPAGGLVYIPASGTPLPVSTGSPCGQLKFDPVKRNLYLPCGQADHITIAVAHVNPGQRTNLLFHAVNTPQSPAGDDVSEIFPWLTTDPAGNIYVIWIAGGNGGNNQVYYTASTDEGKSWTAPTQVNSPPSNSNTFPVATAPATGRLVVSWLGQSSTLDSDLMPSWFNDKQGATAYPWFGYVATITGANGLSPSIAQQPFTAKPMHYGQICNSGTTCIASGGDRTMADYFDVNFDKAGALRFVYNDTTSQYHGAHLFEVRQLTGKAPAAPMADPAGDAQWPHYAPTGPGANQPQLDLTSVDVSRTKTGLQFALTVSNLSTRAAPPGKTNALWLARFTAKSLGTFGEEAYRIFYVGAESQLGGPLSYFVGSGEADTTTPGNGCRSTSTPGNCKIVFYPAEGPATGSVSGNKITITVPYSAWGPKRPLAADATLFSVTGLTFGRNASDDLYADVDVSHAFDLRGR